MVSNGATLVCCFTNLQKTSTVIFKAVSFACMDPKKTPLTVRISKPNKKKF